MRRRAVAFFLWLGFFLALVALIGFIPAILVFVFVYMGWGFGEPPAHAALYAVCTAVFCWFVFDWLLAVHWPLSYLGDWFPALRSAYGLI